MKSKTLAAVVIATILGAQLTTTFALAKDAAFDAFWTKFKTALQKNDKEAIASMTRLPYDYEDKKLDKKGFIQNYDKIFPAKNRTCLLKQNPVQDKTFFSAFCGPFIYSFEKVKNEYLFTEIGAND
ncbi:MAG TPA: hypothetical protein V6C72_10625 [Chroococcales cyanobacterium]